MENTILTVVVMLQRRVEWISCMSITTRRMRETRKAREMCSILIKMVALIPIPMQGGTISSSQGWRVTT